MEDEMITIDNRIKPLTIEPLRDDDKVNIQFPRGYWEVIGHEIERLELARRDEMSPALSNLIEAIKQASDTGAF